MKRSLIRRIISATMVAVIIVAVLCPIFFMIAESDHDCSGEDCPVCCFISSCSGPLKLFGFVLSAAISASLIRLYAMITAGTSRDYPHSDSLISLKVKLTD